MWVNQCHKPAMTGFMVNPHTYGPMVTGGWLAHDMDYPQPFKGRNDHASQLLGGAMFVGKDLVPHRSRFPGLDLNDWTTSFIWLVVSNIFNLHNIWDNPSHWLIFFKMVKTTNQSCFVSLSDSFDAQRPEHRSLKCEIAHRFMAGMIIFECRLNRWWFSNFLLAESGFVLRTSIFVGWAPVVPVCQAQTPQFLGHFDRTWTPKCSIIGMFEGEVYSKYFEWNTCEWHLWKSFLKLIQYFQIWCG